MAWPWRKVIALADMNAYFASVEQKDNPKLKGRPVVVTNGESGRTIVASSYEAKRYGIHTGMHLSQAKYICPELKHCPSRPDRYSYLTKKIMNALSRQVTPDIEVFSIDEAFLDLTSVIHRYNSPQDCAVHIRDVIYAAVGLSASIGMSGNKSMSKFAAKQMRPNGITIIDPNDARIRLKNVPVEDLCGIGEGMKRFLAKYGVRYCGQIHLMPIGVIRQRFGYLGQKIWWMCQGIDHDIVRVKAQCEKTMGHSKVIPFHLQLQSDLLSIALHLTSRLSSRMRQGGFFTSRIQYFVKTKHAVTVIEVNFSPAIREVKPIYSHFAALILRAKGINKMGLTAVELCSERQQSLDFDTEQERSVNRDDVLAQIRSRFGYSSVQEARLLLTSPTRVISPAWGSSGTLTGEAEL